MRIKRKFTIIPALMMLLAFGSFVEAATFVNGVAVDSKVVDGRTLVPVRVVSENLGSAVHWDAATGSVTITGEATIVLSVKNNRAVVGSEVVELDVAPKIYDSRVYVPIRFVSECLKVAVDWDGQNANIGEKPVIDQPSISLSKTIVINDFDNMFGELDTGLSNDDVNALDNARQRLSEIKQNFNNQGVYDYGTYFDNGLKFLDLAMQAIKDKPAGLSDVEKNMFAENLADLLELIELINQDARFK